MGTILNGYFSILFLSDYFSLYQGSSTPNNYHVHYATGNHRYLYLSSDRSKKSANPDISGLGSGMGWVDARALIPPGSAS